MYVRMVAHQCFTAVVLGVCVWTPLVCHVYQRGLYLHRNGSAFVTKLNFSEADSLSSSHAHSLAEDSSGPGGRPTGATGFFNATLECERKAKLTQEQLEFEKEFANGVSKPYTSSSFSFKSTPSLPPSFRPTLSQG